MKCLVSISKFCLNRTFFVNNKNNNSNRDEIKTCNLAKVIIIVNSYKRMSR